MKSVMVMVVALLAAVSVAQATAFSIQAKKDTVTRRKSGAQDIRGGTTSLETETVRYLFTVKRTSLQGPTSATVEWMVLVERADGGLSVGTQGWKTYNPQDNRTFEVQTDTFRIQERDWRGHRGRAAGSVSSEIFGYGVRVVDASGAVLGERYSSSKVQAEIELRLKKQAEPQNGGGGGGVGARPLRMPKAIRRR